MAANARNPRTPAEWQEATNMAEALLRMESARAYGLITGGPEVVAWRCDVILTRAKRMGIAPQTRGVEAVIDALIKGGT